LGSCDHPERTLAVDLSMGGLARSCLIVLNCLQLHPWQLRSIAALCDLMPDADHEMTRSRVSRLKRTQGVAKYLVKVALEAGGKFGCWSDEGGQGWIYVGNLGLVQRFSNSDMRTTSDMPTSSGMPGVARSGM